ncbi:integrase [Pseudobacillus badius]|uniref:integrase n=1 Tax=Bacillus badius TaxID=1455 RepID=UPI003CE6DFD0
MAKRGGNKLKYQVEKSLKAIEYIGKSKKDFRDRKRETGIHSITQMKHALSVAQNFAAWVKDTKGINDLYQLKRSYYRDYLAFMQEKGGSNGHLINIETNLRLLQKGMNQISAEKGFKARAWIPKTRIIQSQKREKPKDRSYSPLEVQSLRERLSENAKVAADLQLAFGLRLREAANTRVAHIVEKNGQLFWKALSDKDVLNTSVGVTKAGRGREALCRPEYEERVRGWIKDREKGEYLFSIRYNSLKSAYYRAGIQGSHTFRHTYAREMLRSELARRGIEREGRSMIQRMLENREAGYRKDHLVTREERKLYREVNWIVDQVHSHLGHGKGRMDLCEVYMKGA